MNRGRWPFASVLTVLVMVLTVVLVCLSWLLSVVGEPVRNLLSSEGIRWLFSHASMNFLKVEFSYFLQIILILGALKWSGLARAVGALLHWPGCVTVSYRQRRALVFSAMVVLVYVCIMLLLTLLPHAVLLSAAGNLYPSPFSEGFISAVTTGVMLTAIIYGTMSNTLRTFREVTRILYAGFEYYGVWVVAAMMTAEFYAAIRYVFG